MFLLTPLRWFLLYSFENVHENLYLSLDWGWYDADRIYYMPFSSQKS